MQWSTNNCVTILVAIFSGSFLYLFQPAVQPALDNDAAAEEKAVRDLLRDLFSLYAKKDQKGIVGFWSVKSPEFAAQKDELERQFAAYDLSLKDLRVVRVTFADDSHTKATARVMADLQAVEIESKEVIKEKFARNIILVKEGSNWRVWHNGSAFHELADALFAATTDEKRQSLLSSEQDLVGSDLAHVLYNMGSEQTDRFEHLRSLATYKLAKVVADVAKDPTTAAQIQIRIGRVYHDLGNFPDALAAYQDGLAILKSLPRKGNEIAVARAMLNVGLAYHNQGANLQGLKFTLEGLEIVQQIKSAKGMGHGFLNLGLIQESNRNYLAAISAYEQAYQSFREAKDPIGEAHARNNMGVVCVALGQFEDADQYLREALKLRQAQEDQSGILNSSNNQADLHRAIADRFDSEGKKESGKKERQLAVKLYSDCLALARDLQSQWNEVNVLGDLAAAYVALDDPDRAIKASNEAATLASKMGYLDAFWKAKTFAGKAYRAKNDLERAHAAFEAAIDTIEQMRYQVGGAELDRSAFFENKLAPYLDQIELLMAKESFVEALNFAERTKSRVLVDTIQIGKFSAVKSMTPEDQDEEHKLLGTLRHRNTMFYAEHATLIAENSKKPKDGQRIRELEKNLEQLERERADARQAYQGFEQKMYGKYATLQMQRGVMKPITLEELGPLVPDKQTALLEFVVVEDETYLFIVTGEPSRTGPTAKLVGIKLAVKREELLNIIAGPVPEPGKLREGGFRDQLATNNLDYDVGARRLYEILLKPAMKVLQGKERLVIVPDDVLWELPFQALQSAANHCLIEDYTISYAPSLTVLRDMRAAHAKRRPQSSGREDLTLLALGNPPLPKSVEELAKTMNHAKSLGALPDAEQEVKDLEALYGKARSKVLVGSDAREEVVKRDAGKYRILHFATHGILDNSNPMFSYLLLSQPGKRSNEPQDDGYLEVWEVMALNLDQTELAVLAACQTARGRIGAGEGVIGMSWAFFVAGCPTTVASQWRVDDKVTKDLMVDFHKNLLAVQKSLSKEEALRSAQLKVMSNSSKRYRHPYYWAGFVLVGDGR